MKRFCWKPKNTVCPVVIAAMFDPALCVTVNELVGTVKLPVYAATPLITLRLLMYP